MATKSNPFDHVTRAIESVKLPGVDMSEFIESRRKDIEAIAKANQALYDMMQELARTQTQMLEQAMKRVQDAAKDAADGSFDPAKQAAAARKAYEKALADMKTLAEMAGKSQAEAWTGITQRAGKVLEEGAMHWPPRKK